LTITFLPCGYAETPQDEYQKMQKELKSQKRKLEETKKKESSILNDLEGINKQLKDVEEDLRKHKKRLASTESTLARIESDIAKNRSNIARQREWIKRKLQAINRNGQHSEMALLFMKAEDISHLMRNVKYLQYIAVYEHKVLSNYQAALNTLTDQEKRLISLRRELVQNKEKVQSEETSLAEKKQSKETLLTSVKKEKSSHAKMLKELEQASKRLLEIIRESERDEKEKSTILSDRNFSKLKGRLPWPVDGRVVIPYGSQRDPEFKTPIFRSGTFIQTASDSIARTVHGGKVVFAEWFKGYGQLVIVNHGDGYHTLYGSLSEIFARVGDIIKRNQTVGRVGNSGIVNAPGVYFEIRYKGKPLDPAQWLQRR
jgi:septal ring factor EnvC (AmiA/AmiB activator)